MPEYERLSRGHTVFRLGLATMWIRATLDTSTSNVDHYETAQLAALFNSTGMNRYWPYIET